MEQGGPDRGEGSSKPLRMLEHAVPSKANSCWGGELGREVAWNQSRIGPVSHSEGLPCMLGVTGSYRGH